MANKKQEGDYAAVGGVKQGGDYAIGDNMGENETYIQGGLPRSFSWVDRETGAERTLWRQAVQLQILPGVFFVLEHLTPPGGPLFRVGFVPLSAKRILRDVLEERTEGRRRILAISTPPQDLRGENAPQGAKA